MTGQNVYIQRTAEQKSSTLLGQSLNADTVAESVYSPSDGVAATVKKIYVCNVSGAARIFRLFHDEDGSTYSTATALYYDKTIAADDSFTIDDANIFMNNSSGNLAFRSDSPSSLCCSVYGEEVRTRAR